MNTDELFLIFGGHAAVLIDRLEKISATISDDPGEIERASFEHRQLVYETRLKLAELYSGEVKEFTGDLFESLDHAP